MNANELADALDVESSQAEYGYVVDDWKLFSDSAKMLRQQQAEIESLRFQLSNLLTKRILRTYDGRLE
jgi:hypothetical protein